MTDSALVAGSDEQGATDEADVKQLDELTDRFADAYMYSGDGDWSKVNDVVLVEGDTIEFQTTVVSYEAVPLGLREDAYEQHEPGKTVVVGVDLAFGDGA